MGCRQVSIFLKMVASICSSLGITASIASGSVIERATFLTIWAKKRQVFVPKAATFSFHLHLRIGSCSVTTDDFNPWINAKPAFQGLSLPVRQYLHNPRSLQTNQHAAIG